MRRNNEIAEFISMVLPLVLILVLFAGTMFFIGQMDKSYNKKECMSAKEVYEIKYDVVWKDEKEIPYGCYVRTPEGLKELDSFLKYYQVEVI